MLLFSIMLATSTNVMAIKGQLSRIRAVDTPLYLAKAGNCTITMISKFVGLTKADCDSLKGGSVAVTSAKTGVVKQGSYTLHPDYDPENWDPRNDIAVIILEEGFSTPLNQLVKLLRSSDEERILPLYKSRFELYSAGDSSDKGNCRGDRWNNTGRSTTADRFVNKNGCPISKFYYESFRTISTEHPARLVPGGAYQVLPDWQLYWRYGPEGSEPKDLDKSLFLLSTPGVVIKYYDYDIGTPIMSSDGGASAILYTQYNRNGFVGFINSESLITRVTPHWPWILGVLSKSSADNLRYPESEGSRIPSYSDSGESFNPNYSDSEGYLNLSSRSFDTYHILKQILPKDPKPDNPLGGMDLKLGRIGYLTGYANGETRFFRLVGLNKEGQVDYFPSKGEDSKQWEYLGTKPPKGTPTPTKIHEWGYDGKVPDVGLLYVYYNTDTKDIEYFVSKEKGDYTPFPVNSESTQQWEYLGTENPDMPYIIYAQDSGDLTVEYLAPLVARYSNLTIKVADSRWARYINLPTKSIKKGRVVKVVRDSIWATNVQFGEGSVRIQKGDVATFTFTGVHWTTEYPNTLYPVNGVDLGVDFVKSQLDMFKNLTIHVKNGWWVRNISLPLEGIKEGREIVIERHSTYDLKVHTGGDSVSVIYGQKVSFIFGDGSWKIKD